jgi:hypothetical protein
MERSNALRTAVANDQVVYGVGSQTYSPMMIAVHGRLGFDFIWVDFEHAGPSPYDSAVMAELSRAAQFADIELLVRLPSGDPSLIRKVSHASRPSRRFERLSPPPASLTATKLATVASAPLASARGALTVSITPDVRMKTPSWAS